MAKSMTYEERRWTSDDGLGLCTRDYPAAGDEQRLPVATEASAASPGESTADEQREEERQQKEDEDHEAHATAGQC